MIIWKCYDVECLPNFFSIAFVDLSDYIKTFSDCVNEKGKPIPLVQKITVAEITKRLATVKKHSFYITDKDDSQLLNLLGYINNMTAHYDENNVAVRTDMFGYNSMNYDKLMVAAFLMYATNCNDSKELCKKLYETSQRIISIQDNKELSRSDYFLNTLREYSLPYIDIDAMQIFALNKVGKGVDANGNTVYFPKGLKQTSINLQWYELLEYEMPPICDKDADLYYKNPQYKGMSIEQLNNLIEKWDRYMIDDYIHDMTHYNFNDVFILCELIRLNGEEVKTRYNVSKTYGVNVLNSSRSNIADVLFEKFYSEFSGLHPSQWKGKKTERTKMAFRRVIFPWIKFKTKECNELLDEMKQVVVTSLGKKALKEVAINNPKFKYLKYNNDSGWFEIKINKLVYTIATGGLHSQDIPRELKSNLSLYGGVTIADTTVFDKNASISIWDALDDKGFIYVHWDISNDSGAPKQIPLELLGHREDITTTTYVEKQSVNV